MMAGHDRIFRPSTSVTSYSSSHTWKAIKEVKQRPGDDVQGHSRGRALSLKNVHVWIQLARGDMSIFGTLTKP